MGPGARIWRAVYSFPQGAVGDVEHTYWDMDFDTPEEPGVLPG